MKTVLILKMADGKGAERGGDRESRTPSPSLTPIIHHHHHHTQYSTLQSSPVQISEQASNP